MRTLKTRVVVFVIGMIVLTTFVIAVMAQRKAERALQLTLEENAVNLLNATRNFVETQHNSILYHKEAILERRKAELRSSVEMAYALVERRYEQFVQGELSEQQAKMWALRDVEALRYDDGVGYFWVNNTDKSYPTLIMHPTMPELEGQKLLTPEYNCVIGTSQNLFHAFIDTGILDGAGYVNYRWPKPTHSGLTEEQPKVSYVKLFQPWRFIIGTGVYIDDIEKEAQKRFGAVISELNAAMNKQKIGDSGYFFIFNESNMMLVHPNLANQDFGEIRNIETGNILAEEIKKAAFTPKKSLEYIWDKQTARGNYNYRKKIFVTHFAPLGWYIAVSMYKEDFEKRVTELTHTMIGLSLIFIVASLILSIWLARSFSRPINQLTGAVRNTGPEGLPAQKIPIAGTDEIVTLAKTINRMLDSIRLSKERLLASEVRFRSIFEAAGEAIWLIRTRDGKISEFNTAAHESLGYSREEFASLDIRDLLAEDDIPVNRYTDEVEGDSVVRFEAIHRGIEDEPHNVLVTCRNIHVGEQNYNLVVIRDVTEKTRMEQLMIQSEKMLSVGGLAVGLAHEINNPLAGILQNAELLQRRLLTEMETNQQAAQKARISIPELQSYMKLRRIDRLIELIIESGARAAQIVRGMLNFARQESAVAQPVLCTELLDNTLLLAANDFSFKDNFDFRKIRILRDYDESVEAVRCYPGKIQQVMLNILQNGADAMRRKTYAPNEEPVFSLRVTQDDLWSIVQIEDNGVGMSENQRKRVFEPFFTTKGVGDGTGLGMSVSYFIIAEDHRGHLDIDSVKGRFTRFTIRLPRLRRTNTL